MKLELGYIDINNIEFSSESKVENGTLYVNQDAILATASVLPQ